MLMETNSLINMNHPKYTIVIDFHLGFSSLKTSSSLKENCFTDFFLRKYRMTPPTITIVNTMKITDMTTLVVSSLFDIRTRC